MVLRSESGIDETVLSFHDGRLIVELATGRAAIRLAAPAVAGRLSVLGLESLELPAGCTVGRDVDEGAWSLLRPMLDAISTILRSKIKW